MTAAAGRDDTLDALLEFVRDTRGFDFTGYKRSSIQRRVSKRMGAVGVESYDEYIDYLQLHSEEFPELFNTLLINVTSCFRDPATWEYLATTIVPQLVAARSGNTPVRIWCAGCASGEEPYTVAMVFARVMGDSAFREQVKIYATDIDEHALEQARLGAYLPRQLESVPQDALERFFERTDQRYVFRNDLRRCVIFGRNDLIQDAPISRIDLLVCRNTLMYFTADTQSQILRRFHFALDDAGVLLLGRSEMLITHAGLFTPVDLKSRAYRKLIRPARRPRPRMAVADPGNGASLTIADTLREAAFDVTGAAQIVLDGGGALVMANDLARRMFGLDIDDFGRPLQDLELSYRPIELRKHLEAVQRDLRVAEINAVRWRTGNQERLVDVRIAPLIGDGVLLGTSIVYVDVTEMRRLEEELATSKRELEKAYDELQSTVEELETTNEELQSTNEELETTNEELQSTNEELETMNEELQSSNEELETMNEELRNRTGEVNDVNAFLETILTKMGIAVVVLDRQQRVQVWNEQARELWGLLPEEAEDEYVMSLDIGLPLDEIRRPLQATLAGDSSREEITVNATNRRGRPCQCRVTLLPLGRDGHTVAGAIMMMDPVEE